MRTNLKRIAIIPARGGSKRLPRKNIAEISGKPIIYWTIKAAIESKLFEEVFVSTEDEEIANIVENCNLKVKVLRRELELAGDHIGVVEVFLKHLHELNLKGKFYDQIFCLYPTAPLRNSRDLIEISNIFDNNANADAVFAATTFSHYPFQALSINTNNEAKAFWPELVSKRSTDLPKLVAGNGSTYAIKTDVFMNNKSFLPSKNLYVYEMESWRSIDIDTKDDLFLLESILLKKPSLLITGENE